jgi:Ca-activated chloride channel homolog
MQTDRLLHVGLVILIVLTTVGVVDAQGVRAGDSIDTLRVDSDLVDLKVSVISRTGNGSSSGLLEQKHFLVFEDGAPQEISFFAAADTPFDLVLLLDLSGSTAKKLGMIRRSAKRFVEATRPIDRIAVVTFSSSAEINCELTNDRKLLKKSIEEIDEPSGGTNFWDSLAFVLQHVLVGKESLNRKAVVVMSDGVDNALPDVYGEGSKTSFEQILSIVRISEALVFPVYIDTEPEEAKRHRTPRSAFAIAREQLDELAQESGTIKYEAKELKDLDRVYARVIHDLGTVYSIGYKPSNSVKDGKWRSVAVRLVDLPDLAVRTKSGYYAGNESQSLNH